MTFFLIKLMQTDVTIFLRIEIIKTDRGLSDLSVPGVCVYKERQPKKTKTYYRCYHGEILHSAVPSSLHFGSLVSRWARKFSNTFSNSNPCDFTL